MAFFRRKDIFHRNLNCNEMEERKKHKLFERAKEFIRGKDHVTQKELMEHFNIGYNSVGKLMDELEKFIGTVNRMVL